MMKMMMMIIMMIMMILINIVMIMKIIFFPPVLCGLPLVISVASARRLFQLPRAQPGVKDDDEDVWQHDDDDDGDGDGDDDARRRYEDNMMECSEC